MADGKKKTKYHLSGRKILAATFLLAIITLTAITLIVHPKQQPQTASRNDQLNIIPNTGISETDANVPRYGVYEITLTASGDYANPYLQMPGDSNTAGFVVATFTGPGGKVIQVDGFWDGGRTWKARMAPTVAGRWTYVTESADPGLDGVKGSFNCVESGSKGFLRVDPDHPHHFIWDDGSPFYWAPVAMMISHFDSRDAQGGNRRVDNGTFQKYVATRAAQGFNAAFWGFYGFNKDQFNRHSQRNEGGAPFNSYDPDRLNPAYFQAGDQRIRASLDGGIIPQLTLGWPDQGIADQIGHARLKRYWRYVIARYAAFNITYNLFGEVQEFGGNYLAILEDYGQLTRRWDPYDHLLGTHTAGDVPSALIDLPWLDYITLQRSAHSTSSYLKYNKPVLNAEYEGYEDFQVSGSQLRPMIWEVRMRNGYFVYESWGDDLNSSGAKYAKIANIFFKKNTNFSRLESYPDLFGGEQGLADPGTEYVVYLKHGGSVTVDLSGAGGLFSAAWFNPRTGITSPTGPASGGETHSYTAPDGKDWVLHLVRAGSGIASDQTIIFFLPFLNFR